MCFTNTIDYLLVYSLVMETTRCVPTVKTVNVPYNGSTIAVKFVDGPGEYTGKEEIIAVITKNTRESYTTINGERNLIFCSGGVIGSAWSVVVGDNNFYLDSYPNSYFCGYVFTDFKEDLYNKLRNRTRTHVCQYYNETDTYFKHIDEPERGLITIAKAVHKPVTDIMKKIAADKLVVEQKILQDKINTARLSGKFEFSDYTYVDIIDKANESVIASDKRITANNVFVCGDRNKLENVADCVVIGNNCQGLNAKGCIFVGRNNTDGAGMIASCGSRQYTADNEFFETVEDLDNFRIQATAVADYNTQNLRKMDLAFAFVLCTRAYVKENMVERVTDALYSRSLKQVIPVGIPPKSATITPAVPVTVGADPVAIVKSMQSNFMAQFTADIDAISRDPIAKKKLDISMAGWKVQYDAHADLFAEGLAELRTEIAEKMQKLRNGK